ncbi:hypothetical protein KAFR_0E02960 [Kazachstania africana CBS 2517]|uniref:Pre-mRNA-splicing factor CWC21 n=1 Tax=Kazachstania africana (strain ATCC 22294 / BCRC 22015 / CBS 2517 / CECT 1963 / NBRC 1671 / NRRL Y-8276) TaxID=1071382 RepID=H2AVP8_KAZAF|nr:hypothetical protein KAFR_0E02960 [Kazachstania africana CBS 2517]CCF58448.1 hypothetical protein KAFR_0E02960 [Kazachstania africana CBS 2517]
MSYNGIGLKSAKGSSTSGHIQKSLASSGNEKYTRSLQHYKKRQAEALRTPQQVRSGKKDKSILLHLNKRNIELQVSEYRDVLEEQQAKDESLTDDVVDSKCNGLREKLLKEWEEEQRLSKAYKSRDKRVEGSIESGPEEKEQYDNRVNESET